MSFSAHSLDRFWSLPNITYILGDIALLNSSRSMIREGFLEKAALEPTSPEASAALKHADSVATFLLRNIVQGTKTEGDDRYSPCCLKLLSPLHTTF